MASSSRTARGRKRLMENQRYEIDPNQFCKRKNGHCRRWWRRRLQNPIFSRSLLISLLSFSFYFFSLVRDTGGRLKGHRHRKGESHRHCSLSGATVTTYYCSRFFNSLNNAKFISSWSKLQTICISSQTECIRRALRIYGLWSSIQAMYKNLFFYHSSKLPLNSLPLYAF
jgi:hypothetical protein